MNRAPWPSPLRLTAVVAWSSFIGATLVTALLLIMAPQLEREGGFSWESLGIWFFSCWLASLVPIISGLALMAPPPSERDQ